MNGACVLHIYLLKTYMYIDIYSNEIYIYTTYKSCDGLFV